MAKDKVLLVDSREKWTQMGSNDLHIGHYLDHNGIPYRVEKLDVGDYMYEGGTTTVDRKQNLEELSRNLTNPADKERFMREVRRAGKKCMRLVVLVETNKFQKIDDLRLWRSKYTTVTGWTLIKIIRRLWYSYGVEFVFCPRRSSAKKIMEILQNK